VFLLVLVYPGCPGRVCVCVCMRACVCACVRACVCNYWHYYVELGLCISWRLSIYLFVCPSCHRRPQCGPASRDIDQLLCDTQQCGMQQANVDSSALSAYIVVEHKYVFSCSKRDTACFSGDV